MSCSCIIENYRVFYYYSVMKKFIISVLLIVVLCSFSVVAEEAEIKKNNWDFSLTLGYDNHSCNDNSVNAFGMTFAGRTKFRKDIDFYADFSLHAWGQYKLVTSDSAKESLPRNKVGFKIHSGFLFDIPVSKENVNLGIGGGFAFARSVASRNYGSATKKFGFTDIGISLMGIGRYKLNDKISIQGEFIPDIYLYNWTTSSSDNYTETHRAAKLGLGLSIKAGVCYSL